MQVLTFHVFVIVITRALPQELLTLWPAATLLKAANAN